MTRQEATDRYLDARMNDGCSCHLNPPCDFCVNGYSLDLDEYLSYIEFDDQYDEVSDPSADYDRAMRGV